MTRRLITIGASHYCEKARWALDLSGLPYREDPHLPFFHIPAARRASGQTVTPILVDGEAVIPDSTRILEHVQAHPDARWRPWPDGGAGEEARRWEARFDDDLGPHSRIVSYYHVLPQREMVESICGWAPASERRGLAWTYPVACWMLRRAVGIDAAGAERSLGLVDAIFAEVDAALADGRRYLAGGQLTGADVTFAALAGPVLSPPQHARLPQLEQLPPALRAEAERLRATRAGAFALRLYAEDRPPGARP